MLPPARLRRFPPGGRSLGLAEPDLREPWVRGTRAGGRSCSPLRAYGTSPQGDALLDRQSRIFESPGFWGTSRGIPVSVGAHARRRRRFFSSACAWRGGRAVRLVWAMARKCPNIRRVEILRLMRSAWVLGRLWRFLFSSVRALKRSGVVWLGLAFGVSGQGGPRPRVSDGGAWLLAPCRLALRQSTVAFGLRCRAVARRWPGQLGRIGGAAVHRCCLSALPIQRIL